MPKNISIQEKVLEMVRRTGLIRVRDIVTEGIHPEYLRRLYKRGLLIRVGRGTYMAADLEVTAHHSLAEACKRIPQGVICLLSALRFHEIGTQNPPEIWMALSVKARHPKDSYLPLRIVRFSGSALSEGVEEHRIEGVVVRVYGGAKTVADCFKYRNKIGLDVALEALKECLREKKATVDELWHYGKICRVANVMKPYLEALV